MWMEWIPVWRLSACSGRLSTRAFERERVFVCHIYVNGQFTHNKIISWRGLANKVCSMSPSNSAEHRRMLHRSHRVQLKNLNRETKAKSLRCARSVGNLTLTLSYVSHSFRPFCITVAWVDQQVFPFNFGARSDFAAFCFSSDPPPSPFFFFGRRDFHRKTTRMSTESLCDGIPTHREMFDGNSCADLAICAFVSILHLSSRLFCHAHRFIVNELVSGWNLANENISARWSR